MSQISEADIFLENLLVDDYKIKVQTARFFTYLLDLFLITETITSSSKKLGEGYRRNERTIRNYIKELKSKNLILVRPHRNQKDPDRPYIEYNQYMKSCRTDEILSKLNYWKKQQSDVFFVTSK